MSGSTLRPRACPALSERCPPPGSGTAGMGPSEGARARPHHRSSSGTRGGRGPADLQLEPDQTVESALRGASFTVGATRWRWQLPRRPLPEGARYVATFRTSGRVEVLKIGTLVRWCRAVEPFTEAGRFAESRGGGGPVAGSEREPSEPLESRRSDTRLAEPATHGQRLLVVRLPPRRRRRRASSHRPNPASATPTHTGVPRSMNGATGDRVVPRRSAQSPATSARRP